MRRLLFLPALALLSPAADAPVSPDAALAAYRGYTRLTKEPKWVGEEFALLCDDSPAKRAYGPHAYGAVHYYANPPAEAHRNSGSKGAWPAGSVLIKEKLTTGDVVRDSSTLGAVAGMIKGAPGSSPKTADWQFFYFDNETSRQSNAPHAPAPAPKWIKSYTLNACLDCHAAGGHDYVFGRFEKPTGTRP